MSVEDVLRRFVIEKSPAAIALQGAWGVGKTHLWGEVVERHLVARPDEAYAYVSLFGINSLQELKAAVAYSTVSSTCKALDERVWKFSPRRLWWRLLSIAPTAASVVPSQYGGGIGATNAINALSFYLVRDRLICIDDVERRGKDLSLKDCLGLVSFLVEHRNCRVCVILNSGELGDDTDTWAGQREKVFLAEVTYDPGVERSVKLGMKGAEGEVWYEDACSSIRDLGVRNVRLIRRMKRFLSIIFNSRNVRTSTVRRVVRDAVFIEFCNSGRALNAPTLEFALGEGPISLMLDKMRTERGEPGMSEKERQWATMAQAYGFYGSEELTRQLAVAATLGFPDSEALTAVIEAADEAYEVEDARQAFRASWELYHDHLEDNATEVIGNIERTWPPVSSVEHVTNLLAVAGMLRRNGRSAKASEFIRNWLVERVGTRGHELDLRELQIFGPIDDSEFLQMHREIRAANQLEMPIADAFASLARSEFDEDAIAAIARSDPESLAQFMEANPGDNLPRAVTECLRLKGAQDNDNWSLAAATMKDALLIIAAKSTWNADRIKHKYGVSVDAG